MTTAHVQGNAVPDEPWFGPQPLSQPRSLTQLDPIGRKWRPPNQPGVISAGWGTALAGRCFVATLRVVADIAIVALTRLIYTNYLMKPSRGEMELLVLRTCHQLITRGKVVGDYY